jgi:hypothetical protein
MIQPSCIIKVPSSVDGGTFFHWWIRFLSPFHDLTGREMDVAAALFHQRYELSKRVADPVLLDSLVLNAESRKLVETRLGISRSYMNVIFTKLRKCNILLENRLNPRFIPDIKPDGSGKIFAVLLVFDFKEDAKRKQEKEQ